MCGSLIICSSKGRAHVFIPSWDDIDFQRPFKGQASSKLTYYPPTPSGWVSFLELLVWSSRLVAGFILPQCRLQKLDSIFYPALKGPVRSCFVGKNWRSWRRTGGALLRFHQRLELEAADGIGET